MGMSAVARLLLARGDAVSGSDRGAWPLARALAADGARVATSFDGANVDEADVVIRSSAYGDGNAEVAAARPRGIPVWKREDAWRELAAGKRVIAVAGTHGKGTTTALDWTALRAGGLEPSLICGAVLRDLGTNAYAGTVATATYRILGLVERAEGVTFILAGPFEARVGVALRLAGAHNARNAAGALAVGDALGVAPSIAATALASFGGTERRLEDLGEVGGISVVDDYAHHPTEIRASIAAVRPRVQRGRVVVLFQPHTASRLRAFFDDFARALRTADLSVVAETFASAREAPDDRAGARALAAKAGGAYAADPESAAQALAERVRPGDLVLVLGAGDIRPAGLRLLALLRDREPVPRPGGGDRRGA